MNKLYWIFFHRERFLLFFRKLQRNFSFEDSSYSFWTRMNQWRIYALCHVKWRYPVLDVLVFLSRSSIFLDNLQFLVKILDFFYFLLRSWQLILLRNSRKIKIFARNPRPCQWKSEKKISCFYNCKSSYKYFSSKVKLRLIFWLRFLHFAEFSESIS